MLAQSVRFETIPKGLILKLFCPLELPFRKLSTPSDELAHLETELSLRGVEKLRVLPPLGQGLPRRRRPAKHGSAG